MDRAERMVERQAAVVEEAMQRHGSEFEMLALDCSGFGTGMQSDPGLVEDEGVPGLEGLRRAGRTATRIESGCA